MPTNAFLEDEERTIFSSLEAFTGCLIMKAEPGDDGALGEKKVG